MAEAGEAHGNQKVFLLNENNNIEIHFITLQSKYLEANGHSVQGINAKT